MKMHVLLIVGAGLLLAADTPKDDAAKKDLQQVQGTWTAVALELEGEKAPEDSVKAFKVVIKDDKASAKIGDQDIEATFKLDPSAKPKLIDFTITAGPDKGRSFEGIYSIEGDELKICYSLKDKDRPDDFTAKAGSMRLSWTWKRDK